MLLIILMYKYNICIHSFSKIIDQLSSRNELPLFIKNTYSSHIACHVSNFIYVHLFHSVYTVNIALNKPAYQQYQYLDNRWNNVFNARNAVDGQKSNLTWQAGQCVISANNKRTAIWWVNLTSILSIHHITIYYRTGDAEWSTYK